MNGKESATLAKRDEVFTYNVKTRVAQDATAFAVTDTLVDVLEFAGTSSATLTEDQVKANGGQAVELTFDAKIKAGANLSAYVKEDGRTIFSRVAIKSERTFAASSAASLSAAASLAWSWLEKSSWLIASHLPIHSWPSYHLI
ncbi:hypothetical protein V470_11070 [Streptococcus sp. VT 162]|nr:hypothetical protein V470_11070 [Streptococcus sp. VT 162]